MNLRRVVGFLVVIFILFWIISSPDSASGSVNGILANLQDAGQSLVSFMSDVTH